MRGIIWFTTGDILIEGRTFTAEQAQTTESGLLMGVYRHNG